MNEIVWQKYTNMPEVLQGWIFNFPYTFDAGMIAAVSAVVTAAGYAVRKRRVYLA